MVNRLLRRRGRTPLAPTDIELVGAFSASYQRLADAMLPLSQALGDQRVADARTALAGLNPELADGDAKAGAIADPGARSLAEDLLARTRRVIGAFDRLITLLEHDRMPDREVMEEFRDSNVKMFEADSTFRERLLDGVPREQHAAISAALGS